MQKVFMSYPGMIYFDYEPPFNYFLDEHMQHT